MTESNPACCAQTGLPVGDHPAALFPAHFPTHWQAVLWRNWSLLTPERLARVLGAAPGQIVEAGAQLGLHRPTTPQAEAHWLSRGFITIIRQNWHLLSYEQLLDLLQWTPQHMAFVLKEDDFLWIKLGQLKPRVGPVRYEPLTADQQAATRDIAGKIARLCPDHSQPPAARPFDFLQEFARAKQPAPREKTDSPFGLRLAYSYSAVYGDPLLDPALDPYPEGLLQKLADQGVNAVWLQAVLYTLVPWFGQIVPPADQQARIANLNALVEKAQRFGIGIYLYLNEPRGMEARIFQDRPQWKGGYYPDTDAHAMCPGSEEMLACLEGGVHDLFKAAPGLAGALTISMSENVTHCRSKPNITPCPRCDADELDAIVARVNNTMARGMHRANPKANMIVWSWGWRDELGKPGWPMRCIDKLDPRVSLMCTSEANLPTDAAGYRSIVGDYSISKVGPSTHSLGYWQHARKRNLPVLAKVQLNNTWECSAVPYLPVPFLVKKHLDNLRDAGVSGLMVGWTLGGYPGGNLPLADKDPKQLATEHFGPRAAETIARAWHQFGEAFEHFPIQGVFSLYFAPQNYGPSNLLYARPTGYQATMVGFPYDDLDTWRGRFYPPDVFEAQFEALSIGWAQGLQTLEAARAMVPPEQQANYIDLHNVSQAAYCHFRSTCLQIRFIRLRDENPGADNRQPILAVLDEELALTRTLLGLIRRDSRIGYEASNHYYYSESSLMEKLINLSSLMETFGRQQ